MNGPSPSLLTLGGVHPVYLMLRLLRLFTLFTLLAYLNYTLRNPSQNWTPTAHSRTRFVARAPSRMPTAQADGAEVGQADSLAVAAVAD